MESKIYNQEGKETGSINLPASVFGLPWNSDLVHQVVVSEAANKRNRVAHTKDRGEVRGGGKKPWRQKGTGRARHGSIRSPIWIGGGVTHGPTKEKNYEKKIGKKMKAKALFTILSEKLRQNEILFVDNINLKESKTKEAKKVLEKMSKISGFEGVLSKKNNSAVITFWDKNRENERSFRNFSNFKTGELRNITPSEILNHKYLIIIEPKESVEFIAGKLNKKVKMAKEGAVKTAKSRGKTAPSPKVLIPEVKVKTPTPKKGSVSRPKVSGKKASNK